MSRRDTQTFAQSAEIKEFINTNKTAAMDAVSTFSSWLKTMSQAQAQYVQFVQGRINEDIRLPGRLMGCRSAMEMFDEQVLFLSTMLSDYQAETQKMLDLWSDSCRSPQDRPEERPNQAA